ncbi:MAG TPA: glutathione S-transferase family protein [Steroidobacteraceae bacterium]|nr:glutathione S-transferase family protein [Steroidobacteraceae bacterium]
MALEIFWGSGSPYSWRVLLAAEIKRLKYESRLLEFSKGHLQTLEFLQMNPRRRVPVVRDDGFVLFESLPILEYFEERSSEVPLFGKDPRERAVIRRLISEFEGYLRAPLFNLTLGLLRSAGAGPPGRPMTPDEFNETAEAVQRELKTFEERVAGGSWPVGVGPSAVDVAIYPFLAVFERAAATKAEALAIELGLHPLRELYPSVRRWMGLVEAVPGYERAYPPHWRAA